MTLSNDDLIHIEEIASVMTMWVALVREFRELRALVLNCAFEHPCKGCETGKQHVCPIALRAKWQEFEETFDRR